MGINGDYQFRLENARAIAKNLDTKDGENDGNIKASIWNQFVSDKGGKRINSEISLADAVRSITSYLKNVAAKGGESVRNLATQWINNPIDKEITKACDDIKVSVPEDTEYAQDVQECFDAANALLVDGVHNKDKLSVHSLSRDGNTEIKRSQCIDDYSLALEEGTGRIKVAYLPDGRAIRAEYDEKGEIIKVAIDYDLRKDDKRYMPEVEYSENEAKYNPWGKNDEYDGSISSGYDFEKIKTLAKEILGEWQEE